MTANLLKDETSPYLLQHKDNPVHWQPWSPETLEMARRENKPILLSVGYSACHWCHVMAHESFENQAIADLMNGHYINIKVDREERPDIDAIYQSALGLLGERGGWPLTMFLTPAGEPFWGGTYFPATSMYGRPAFPDILNGIAETYRTNVDKVTHNADALREALGQMSQPTADAHDLTTARLDEVADKALHLVDTHLGGTIGAPKFPQPSFFKFLWRAHRRLHTQPHRDAVTLTLDQMCQGGIYDHLGGGFSRYSTDEEWLAPHFEKMLYDNALLIELLSEAWQVTGNPLYATRVRETIDWALREMRVGVTADGRFAFTAAFDADSEGVEGKFYVWDTDQVIALLGDDAPLFMKTYNVTPHGNWEGHTILNRSHNMALGNEDEEAALTGYRDILFKARLGRIPPGRDDKALTDWNGMMIAALAQAGTAFSRPDWITTAETVFAFVLAEITAPGDDGDGGDSSSGRLRHTWCAGAARHPAVIDDYANMARAALLLHEVTGKKSYIEQTQAWVAVADRHYWDDADGGYFLTADDTTDIIIRSKTIHDNAVPSGNGTMVEVLARLFHLGGDPAHRDRALRIVRLFAGNSLEYLINVPTMLNGFELLERAVQVVVIGDAGAPDTGRLLDAVFAAPLSLRVLSHLDADAEPPAGHPAAGKRQIDGVATAYVCVGQTCGLAVTDAQTLGQQLSMAAEAAMMGA